MKKIIVSLILMVLLLTPITVCADGYTYIPYSAYGYDEWNNSSLSTAGYMPDKTVSVDIEGNALFDKPQDMVISDEGIIYVLNSADKGITVLNKEFEFIKVLNSFVFTDGKMLTLKEPMGIFIRDERLFIADKGLQKVIICDLNGNIILELGKPKSEVFPQEKEFLPTKVLADSYGNIYVIVEGVYQGAVCFDANGEFTEFFGSNDVVASASVVLQRFWRNFMTEAQRDSTAGIVPTEYSNFDITSNDFIFSCTAVGSEDTNQIRKLNPLGDNVYKQDRYGDMENNWVKGKLNQTSFVDLAVDEKGFVFALDSTYGRIFVYDADGNETFIFGAQGDRVGNFSSAVAIDIYDRNVFVLDTVKSSITRFERTGYGEAVYNATIAYMNGDYQGSKELWEEVLLYNCNNKAAYNGIGKALYYIGDYDGAREYFILGADKEQESGVFNIWRKGFMRKLLVFAVPSVAVILFAVVIIKKIFKRRQLK